MKRRAFLKTAGLAAMALGAGSAGMAGPFEPSDFERLAPADKKLSAEWIRSLFERGEPESFEGDDLAKIGMPVGGLCAGQVYLGGDGRLWHWDIFNLTEFTGDSHYANPPLPHSPFEQGFAIRVHQGEQSRIRRLDASGFRNVTFRGEYPIGRVTYGDPDEAIEVTLEAFSPFIPLNVDASSLPAIVMEFTIRNNGAERADVDVVGWLENPVCHRSHAGQPQNRVEVSRDLALLECSAISRPAGGGRAPVVFEDFEGDTYRGWAIEGEAFGTGPARGAIGRDQTISGFEGKGLVNSYRGTDALTGKLTSAAFTIDRRYICFLIGGGNHPGETCVNLLVAGKVEHTATGANSDEMHWTTWDVGDLAGRVARIEIVDKHTGGWGHIDVDEIEFRDEPRPAPGPLETQPDFGTMTLCLTGGGSALASGALPGGRLPDVLFDGAGLAVERSGEAAPGTGAKRGALGRRVSLEAGRQARVTFVLAWYFPNLRMERLPGGRHYATRFDSATRVARYVARERRRLTGETRTWRDTWYDSTLPHWFLDRTFANTSILATSTAYHFPNGRFYGWEGVGCCAGTCTHVWHYAHAPGRLFPELERSAREMADFGVSFDPATGLIDHRGEFHAGYAADGQAGCILRAYREHQMSADGTFLARNWPRIKKALEYLIGQDGNDDGILEGAQHNTLDSAWYGPIAWISSLYVAALRAGEQMAYEMGDEPFAAKAGTIAGRGSEHIVERLWNGEYFIQRPDPGHPEAMRSGDGCEIDQVFGQSWAFQVGLARILPVGPVRSALQALWKYNFTPDVGPYREKFKIGRWYAMPGEAGLIMCTFPRGGREGFGGAVGDWAAGYFNECMTGFEYQAAGHMIWEGMVEEGLAVVRAIHDRYHPSRRNPWNEVECGDHYARAMASYGVYLAACGWEYHGPAGHLGFAPRLSADRFRAAFTAAEGWGSISQERTARTQRAAVEVKHGRLVLRTVGLELAEAVEPRAVSVRLSGQDIGSRYAHTGGRILITLAEPATLHRGDRIEVAIER